MFPEAEGVFADIIFMFFGITRKISMSSKEDAVHEALESSGSIGKAEMKR